MTGEADPPRFDDGKDPQALRTIGEVAAAFGIRQHVLRYWEQQFPMLKPLKRSGGRRYYRSEDVVLVETIDRLINREGYTLKGARQAIEKRAGEKGGETAAAGAKANAEASVPSIAPAVRDILPELRAIRRRLAAALAA